jgi:CYTH domain-containing protein
MIAKTRVLISLENQLTAELDIYYGALEGLLTVEVEFENMADALAFTPPEWFGRDVSDVKAYRNNHLSRYGLPKESI